MKNEEVYPRKSFEFMKIVLCGFVIIQLHHAAYVGINIVLCINVYANEYMNDCYAYTLCS